MRQRLQRRHQGRYKETTIEDDHQLKSSTYPVMKLVDGQIKMVDEPALTALNMRLRDDYTQDCVKACCAGTSDLVRGFDYRLTVPNTAFHRQIGEFRTSMRRRRSADRRRTWARRKNDWLPSTRTATSSPR